MDLTPNHKLHSLISVTRNSAMERTVEFPKILKTEHGYQVGIVTLQGERIEDPMVAFLLELVKWGYDHLENYSNLKVPTDVEPLDVPTPRLPWNLQKKLRVSRPTQDFFEFRKVLPEGVKSTVKNWRAKAVVSKTSFHLPTLCWGKLGYRDVYEYGAFTAYDAAFIAAIQSGCRLRTYDNRLENFCIDDSPERIAFLKGRMSAPDFPQMVEDSGWTNLPSSISHRGINDFGRKIKFSSEVSTDNMTMIKELLSLDECPGYTGIYSRSEGDNTFVFSTTHDSSD